MSGLWKWIVEVGVGVEVGVESQVEVTERAFPTLPDWLWKEDGREVCIWQREPNSITHCKLNVHTRNTVREGCHVFIPHPSLSHMDGPHPDPPFTCRPMRRYQRRAEVHRQAYDEREVMAQVTCR
jgi:hypothetical protein